MGKVKEMEREASLEIFKKKGLEVLYLDEPYAELCFSKIFDFEGVKLRSVQKAGDLRINWDKDEGERYKNLVTMYKPLTKWWEKNVAKPGSRSTRSRWAAMTTRSSTTMRRRSRRTMNRRSGSSSTRSSRFGFGPRMTSRRRNTRRLVDSPAVV